MSDAVDELPVELGVWIGNNLKADIYVGQIQYAGWAGYFDLSKLRTPPPIDLTRFQAVIVAVWPNGQTAVEGFGNHVYAGLRWLQWDECFRWSPTPDDRDIVFTYDWDTNRFIVGDSIKVKDWKTLEKFLKRKLRHDARFRGRNVWFYDKLIGNYYHWEL